MKNNTRRILFPLLLIVEFITHNGLGHAFTSSKLPIASPLPKGHQFRCRTTAVSAFNPFSETSKDIEVSEEVYGYLALASVPIIWGTYVPLVQFLYQMTPAVPGVLFQAAYFSVASISSLSLLSIAPEVGQLASNKMTSSEISSDEIQGISPKLNPLDLPVKAGFEIGTYLFLGATLQVLGLETVPAARAGFLVQFSTILVPLVEGVLLGTRISSTTWTACMLALTGIGIMGFDGQAVAIDSSIPIDETIAGISDERTSSFLQLPTFGTGELLTLAAAGLYTMSIVRLGSVTKESSPLRITAAKSTVEMFLSMVLVLASLASVAIIPESSTESAGLVASFLRDSGNSVVGFVDVIHQQSLDGLLSWDYCAKVAGATIYTGVVATALLVLAQSYGQQHVKSPTQANLIYSLQPLCTAGFSFLLLGQTMGTMGYAGATLMGVALILVATSNSTE